MNLASGAYIPIDSVYGGTFLPTNTILINSYHMHVNSFGDDAYTTNKQLAELLATIYHEGLHYKEGWGGFYRTYFEGGHHSGIEDASQAFADEPFKNFLRIYYGR